MIVSNIMDGTGFLLAGFVAEGLPRWREAASAAGSVAGFRAKAAHRLKMQNIETFLYTPRNGDARYWDFRQPWCHVSMMVAGRAGLAVSDGARTSCRDRPADDWRGRCFPDKRD
jgi:hypothetical protein